MLRLPAAATIAILTSGGEPQAASPAPVTPAAPKPAASSPASTAAATAATKEPGFVPLFNGQDLSGWTGDTAGYLVEGGAIACGPKGTNLYTEREYSNFVLRLSFRLAPGANNGIGIRAPLAGDAAYEGMEVQVLDDGHEKYKGWLKDWQRHGSVYGIAASDGSTAALRPAGEWNDEEIVVDGRRIKVTLNGRAILDVDLDEAMRGGTRSGKDHPGARRASGHIGFLGHGDRVEYRDVRILELPAAAAAQTPKKG
jgi:hypothetical protein